MTAVEAGAPPLRLHAAPLVAVDAYEIVSPEEITSTKAIRADDPYLDGHYPDFTIYPGIFIVESVVQTVRILTGQALDPPLEADLAAITSVRFITPMLPGDTLHIRCRCLLTDGDLLSVKADCRTADGAAAAQMKLAFRLVKGVDDD